MSEDLFRVCVIRPALRPDPRYPPIKLAQETPYQISLAAVVNANPNDPRKGLEDTSSAFIASDRFVPVTSTDDSTKRLDKAGAFLNGISTSFKTAENTHPQGPPAAGDGATEGSASGNTPETEPDDEQIREISHASLAKELQTIFENQELGVVLSSYENFESRLKDSIIALRLLGIEQTDGNLAVLGRRLRTIQTLRKTVDDNSFPLNDRDLQCYDTHPLLVPTFAELKSILSSAEAREAAAATAKQAAQDRIDSLWKSRLKLIAGIKNVVKLPALHRQYIEPVKFDPVAPVVDMTHLALAKQHLQLANNLTKLTLTSFENGLTPQTNIPRAPAAAGPDAAALASDPVASIAAIASPLVNMSKTLLDSLAAMPSQPRKVPALSLISEATPFALKKDAPLAESTRSLFKEVGIDPTTKPVDSVVHNMNQLLAKNWQDLDDEYRPYSTQVAKIQLVGGLKVQYQKPALSKWAGAFSKGLLTPPRLINEVGGNLLRPAGRVTILGVADLLVVKQQLIRYEGGDVAYIENLLKGENKVCEVDARVSQSTEVTTETETSEEALTETTIAERFEVSNESANTIKKDESMKAGVTVSASYGPTVSVSANASYSTDRSQTDSKKAASRYAKDVTTKATEKIAERVLQRTLTKTFTETTTKDVHTLSNTGAQHISGVYQWQNKVYEAQVWSYGKQTILDFMIPEPGAFYLDKQTDPHETANTLMAVPPFEAQPSELDGETAMKFGVQYGVTDLDSPPAEMCRVTASYAAGKEEPHSKADVIKIPAGFQVSGISATASGVSQLDKNQNHVVITCVSAPSSA